jgi:hypothetical protein
MTLSLTDTFMRRVRSTSLPLRAASAAPGVVFAVLTGTREERSTTEEVGMRCGRLVETLPGLQHNPNRPEDVLKVDADGDGVGGDDAADALRYLVATKSRTVTQGKLRGL